MNEVKITRPAGTQRPARIGYRGRSVILYTPPETETTKRSGQSCQRVLFKPATGL